MMSGNRIAVKDRVESFRWVMDRIWEDKPTHKDDLETHLEDAAYRWLIDQLTDLTDFEEKLQEPQ